MPVSVAAVDKARILQAIAGHGHGPRPGKSVEAAPREVSCQRVARKVPPQRPGEKSGLTELPIKKSMNLVILDRDGVINEDSTEFIKAPEDWVPIPGSLDAIARLNRAGFRVVVATNQSGIRRRLLDIGTLNRIHEVMHRQLAGVGGHVEAIFICPCHPKDDCSCFKPNPGMLLDIAARLRVSLETVPYIGDKLSDVEAARAAGARPILVKTGVGAKTLEENPDLGDVGVFENLAEVADSLIADRA